MVEMPAPANRPSERCAIASPSERAARRAHVDAELAREPVEAARRAAGRQRDDVALRVAAQLDAAVSRRNVSAPACEESSAYSYERVRPWPRSTPPSGPRTRSRRRPHAVAGVDRRHAHQQRVAPRRDVVEVGERDVRVLAQRRLDPVLLRLVHRDPVGARGHALVARAAPAEDAGAAEPQRRLEPVHVDVHLPQPLDELARVAELAVGQQEVRADADVRDRELDGVRRLHDLVGLQDALLALRLGLRPDPRPAVEHLAAVLRRPVDGRPVGAELLVDAQLGRRRAALLIGHAGGAEARRGHGVAVAHEEQVVDGVVEVALRRVTRRPGRRRCSRTPPCWPRRCC